MYSRTISYSVCAVEDIIAHLIDVDRRLGYLQIRYARRAVTDEDAEELGAVIEARRQLETARRRLAAAHPNKEERR